MSKVVLLIDEGHLGHLTQSRSLAEALAEQQGMELSVVDVRMTLRGFLRPLLRKLLAVSPQGLPYHLLRMAYRCPRSAPTRPALIVSSGGQSVPYALSLARRYSVPFVFCSYPTEYPPGWMDVVVSPVPVPGHPGEIVTEVLVTSASPQRLSERGRSYRQQILTSDNTGREDRIACLLVGGDARDHAFSEDDLHKLAAGVNHLGHSQGWRWLVSTSPRTSPRHEQFLRAAIDHDVIAKAVWWHDQPESVVPDFLGAADITFVTEDSLSMLSEAISAGRPVVSLVPHHECNAPRVARILEQQEARRRLKRVAIADLPQFIPDLNDWDPVTESLVDRYAIEVSQRLESLGAVHAIRKAA